MSSNENTQKTNQSVEKYHQKNDDILVNIKDLQKQITIWQNENTNKLDEIKLSIIKFENFIFWYRVSKAVKFVLIVLPIILTYFFVIPWFNNLISNYNDIYLRQNERIDKTIK